MPAPTGLLSFPGIDQVLSWSFTLSHGISPSAALVEIAPQFGLPAEVGPIVISFGDIALEFADCVLDSANVRRNQSGMIVSLSILDRRWRWRYGQISGRYNRDTIRAEGLRCLDGWEVPQIFEQCFYIVQGKRTADAYNDAARKALEDDADFLLCVEDDHLIPAGTFEILWKHFARNERAKIIAGAWYPLKKIPRTGAPIVLREGRRATLDDDDAAHDVYAVPQGFTLIPTAAFREISQPWFAATGCLTQDSYFSQLAREAGWRLIVDTSARIKHVDRETGRIYE
jgi:hypothetical protein